MHHNQPSWLDSLVWRRFIVISGWLAWFAGSDMFRIGQDVATKSSWQTLIMHQAVADGLFVFLLLYGLAWIGGSMTVLRSLAREPKLRAQLQAPWWAEPLLLQIFTFGEHWIMATFYLLATGDAIRGGILGWLSALHILVVLLAGPAWVERHIRET